jgi:hypothetical protein
MKTKLSALIITFFVLSLISGLGYMFYNFHSESLSVIVGIICLMFIRHIYVAIHYTLKENE